MSRKQFMEELEHLLSDIPIEERAEALQYYNDYFADAGEDQEDKIIKELGSPTRIAGIIKADLNSNGVDPESRGYFTEKGYEDTVYQDEKYEIMKKTVHENEKKTDSAGAMNSSTEAFGKQNLSGGKLLLIIILAIFAIPVVIPLMFSVLGTMLGLGAALVGITIGFGIAGVVLIAIGIGLFLLGLMQLSIPTSILLLCGAGLLVFGIGVMFMIVSVLVAKILIPALVRGLVYICRLPFKNRSVTA